MGTGTLCVLHATEMCGGNSGGLCLSYLTVYSVNAERGRYVRDLIKVLNRIADQLTRIADVCDGRTITLYEAITAHNRCKNRESEDGKEDE